MAAHSRCALSGSLGKVRKCLQSVTTLLFSIEVYYIIYGKSLLNYFKYENDNDNISRNIFLRNHCKNEVENKNERIFLKALFRKIFFFT